ncbi:efflux RND transporter permease subunit [Bradyrhizobium sp. ISRA443]|uniref:efflux RND transporter permease subunit n=1 Tax=unclassified Bradyrhizobium TaxID=2631580 RepID=UPI002478DF08|nr:MULTISPECIES: efflux RND transporter permease subunit [unclassified Bradyrhizobium]WGR92294.1 efflux RND transporter permease subunit [Bradyrhizobium sp. ISRA435]WGR96622.1 efflux RND transporter permease subunit [Bradyrhizobium sp. ISRA436]WGS03509.1 efflux RND transporter permease subunit [Bradyrhizobium sp. ISRA437]WGS10393.1 efflux RND transporter permease subunit [Bradyrhizobium sp. ISRA443]
MDPSTPFIRRPVATTLLTLGLAAAGVVAFFKLPVSPLPQVDFPTISVRATLPGASPQDVATTVASPLERHLGQIADVTEMTSSSSVGATRITLQFGLNRDINGAARDVQAAINAARADLPTSLRSNPTYRKVNPADAPILILTLTSDTLTRGDLYDAASTVLAQKLSQVEGIGEVVVGGSSLPAVRVELIPQALYKYGIGLEDVRAALSNANAHSPKGGIDVGDQRYQIYANDQAKKADDYKSLIVAYRNGAAVHLSDVGEVVDGVENLRNSGLANGKPAVLIILYRQPNANIISTVDLVKGLMPQLKASVSPAIDIGLAVDRSTTIRTSLHDVERTLVLAVLLVIIVVFAFLRNARATLIPVVAVSVSLVATFGAMYLIGYSLDNLSLMALTVATGFVVDDAIVVLENVTRYIEEGMSPLQAALKGANEVGFTVLSMSISLIAVFIPILLMAGIVGRLFREFAMTISISILISLAISLATTPMMCAVLLKAERGQSHGRLYWASERIFEAMLNFYRRTLTAALQHPLSVMLILAAVFGLNFYLYDVIPKGFFPQQDTGRLVGSIQADQSVSFQLMQQKLAQFVNIIKSDPAVETAVGFTGGGQTNSGFVFVSLKPLDQRKISADGVIRRLRREMAVVPGASLFLQAVQDIRVGGRASNAQYQYTLQGSTLEELNEWTPKIAAALQHDPNLADVNSDQQNKGLESNLVIDRDAAARLGITVSQVDNTLYDAFGQRQVSTIYVARNQYHVIMEVAPRYWQNPETLKDVYISKSGASVGGSQSTNAVAGTVVAPGSSSATTAANAQAARNQATNSIGATGKGVASTGSAVSTSSETMIPLSAVASFKQGATPLAVNHQGLLVANTISFNLPPNVSLSTAVASIEATMNRIGVPATIRGTFQGTAKAFQDSLNNQPFLILAALVTIYIVLGVLYESYVHPLTILSTLPSAGVGALLALMAFKTEFSIMALIGVILLIGIVKKNAIMMIDFALEAERKRGLEPLEAIREACLLRFRPIMMTTMAALLGAVPLAVGMGEGGDLRQPLGIAIVGGLILSQVLTLYTTPVIYLYLDRFRLWAQRVRRGGNATRIPGSLQPGE